MGRQTTSYRGHLLTMHGGDLPGFHSQVSFMPRERIGVIVQVIGDHSAPLYNLVSYNVYERLLGMDLTPWSERMLDMRLKNKEAGKQARAKAGEDRIPNTRPSHALAEYAGDYENPAYGVMKIALLNDQLQFDFHKMQLPLTHVHYDRFDTQNDERDGMWSLNFRTNPQGDIDQALMSLDEAEAIFTRKADALDAKVLEQLAGSYELPNGMKIQVAYVQNSGLSLIGPGQPPHQLTPTKGLKFRIPQFSDLVFEFIMENGQVVALKEKDPASEFLYPRK